MGSVGTPKECQLVTFPVISPLNQPAPKGLPIQCFIRRDKKTSTYHLYLGPGPEKLSSKPSKPLLVAKRIRRLTRVEFMIYSSDGVSSQLSDHKLIGTMRSNFQCTKHSIFETQILQRHSSHDKNSLNNEVGTVSYVGGGRRRPRKMECVFNKTPTHIQSTTSNVFVLDKDDAAAAMFFRNRAPMWVEKFGYWCLNFKGRVKVKSIKNFQLLDSSKDSKNSIEKEQEKVILQFGKAEDDIFSMDYCYPLSAFQAFAICLSSFNNILH